MLFQINTSEIKHQFWTPLEGPLTFGIVTCCKMQTISILRATSLENVFTINIINTFTVHILLYMN